MDLEYNIIDENIKKTKILLKFFNFKLRIIVFSIFY